MPKSGFCGLWTEPCAKVIQLPASGMFIFTRYENIHQYQSINLCSVLNCGQKTMYCMSKKSILIRADARVSIHPTHFTSPHLCTQLQPHPPQDICLALGHNHIFSHTTQMWDRNLELTCLTLLTFQPCSCSGVEWNYCTVLENERPAEGLVMSEHLPLHGDCKKVWQVGHSDMRSWTPAGWAVLFH